MRRLFVEDDCRLPADTTHQVVLDVALMAGPRIGWLGYGARVGEPKVGAHLVSFTRVALAVFRQGALQVLQERALALDTLLH